MNGTGSYITEKYIVICMDVNKLKAHSCLRSIMVSFICFLMAFS